VLSAAGSRVAVDEAEVGAEVDAQMGIRVERMISLPVGSSTGNCTPWRWEN